MNMFDILFAQQINGGSEPPEPQPPVENVLYYWDFTKSLIDEKQGEIATLYGATQDSNGVYINRFSRYVSFNPLLFQPGRAYEIKVKNMSSKIDSSSNGRFFMWNSSDGFILRNNTSWECYIDGYWRGTAYGNTTDTAAFNDAIFRLEFTEKNNHQFITIYKDGELFYNCSHVEIPNNSLTIGASSIGYYDVTIESFKIIDIS